MKDGAGVLPLLQHADSFFPSGAVAFSQGLETLHAEGRLADAQAVARFLEHQLVHRWASAERAVLAAAWGADGDLDTVRCADTTAEATTLPAELRDGSKRSGCALLGVHAELGTPGAADYRQRVRDGADFGAFGHLAVMQGLVWRGTGLDLEQACAASAHALRVGMLGAALRLGAIGHLAAQRILTDTHALIGRLMASPPPPIDAVHAYTPVADIALMRHETLDVRLFSN